MHAVSIKKLKLIKAVIQRVITKILLLSQTFMLQTGKFVMSPVQIQEKAISEMNLQRDGSDKADMEKHFKIIY